MSALKKYGEIKVRKNIYPQLEKNIAEKGTIGILVCQNPVSEKSKQILRDANITVYHGIEPADVEILRNKIKEHKNVEKIERE